MGKPIRVVEVYSNRSTKDKLITRKITHSELGYSVDVALAVLVVVTKDFNPNKKINVILHDTSSYQIRPKVLYKSTRGLYYKNNDGRRYLELQEIIYLKLENQELGKWI